MKFYIYSITIIGLTILNSCSYQSIEADLIVHNAKIYSVNENFDTYESMAIKDGKILELGPEWQIINKYSAKTKIDAKKKPIYPGFIDGHCHFLRYGLSLQKVNLVGTNSFEEVLEKVNNHYQQNPSEWIIGRGWDQNDWEIKNFPNKDQLDKLFPEVPVILTRVDGHAALANTQALKRANIDNNTKLIGGIVEAKNGKLTGILIDNAIDLVQKVIPKPSKNEIEKGLKNAEKNCFAVGLTTVDDAGLTKNQVEIIDEMHKNGSLKIKVYAMLTDNKENLDHFLKKGPYKTDFLNVCSFKFYADGALGSRGACLKKPYEDDPENYGLILNEKEYFETFAPKLYEADFQMNTHCIGDSANKLILGIYSKTLKGQNDKRWRIEHAQVIAPEDFKYFKNFSIVPSVQSLHATSDMYWAEERLGHKRVEGAYAYKDLLNQNKWLALGTDFPVETIDPLKTFYASVVRKDEKGFPKEGFQINNALSREETLRGMTIWAALSNFEEKEKGSLEIGKFADFVILSNDLMTATEEQLKSITVESTFINGEKVF